MSIIKDLVFKIEGYGDTVDYNIESITRFQHGRIVIVVRENKTSQKQGADNDSNK